MYFFSTLKNFHHEIGDTPFAFRTGYKSPFSMDDVKKMLFCSSTFDRKAVYYLSGDKMRELPRSTHIDMIFALKEVMDNKRSISIKEAESWNEAVALICKDLWSSTTAHIFLSPAGGGSFPLHTDPDHVLVNVMRGQKRFKVGDKYIFILNQGDWLYIPKNMPHQAYTDVDSCIISYGFSIDLRETDTSYEGVFDIPEEYGFEQTKEKISSRDGD